MEESTFVETKIDETVVQKTEPLIESPIKEPPAPPKRNLSFATISNAEKYLVERMEGHEGEYTKEELASILGIRECLMLDCYAKRGSVVAKAYQELRRKGVIRTVQNRGNGNRMLLKCNPALHVRLSDKASPKVNTQVVVHTGTPESRIIVAINEYLAEKKEEMLKEVSGLPGLLNKVTGERDYYKGLSETYHAELETLKARSAIQW